MLFQLVVMAVLGALVLVAPAFAQEVAAPIADPGVDSLMALLTGLLGSGAAGPWGLAAIVAVSLLRAGAATLSKHITDEQLGRTAPYVNWLGGNTKHAANAGKPRKGKRKTGRGKRTGAAATSLVFGVLVLGLGCTSTGDPARDQIRRELLVFACKSQCPIAYTVAIDACDGDVDGQTTEPAEPSVLYRVCVQEAGLVRFGCPLLCDQIPLPTAPPEDATAD